MKIKILNDGGLTCFKGTATLIDDKELEMFDNNIHEIAKEYCKMIFKEKDQILTQRLIKKQEEEIERLNNIIEELDKWLEDLDKYTTTMSSVIYIGNMRDKLKELKENNYE